MGTRTEAHLVYGVKLKEGSFVTLGGSQAEPGTPKHLAWYEGVHNGISIVSYCSSSYPEYIVCAAEPRYKAQRGFITEIDPLNLVVDLQVRAKILAYCKEHGLEIDGELDWLLFSYWG